MEDFPKGNLWHASASEEVLAPPLENDLDVDLAVIGGGFTGCAAALEAARLGASVALLEGREIGHGGSGRNVGLVNAGLWLPPDEILAQMGEAAGRRLIDVLGGAPARVFGLIEREGISCEATRNGTLHLAHAASGAEDLASRHRQGNRVGAPVQLLDTAETVRRTGSDAFAGALLDPRAGTVQPLAYCRGLARAAQAAGARLHGRTQVTELSRSGEGWEIRAGGRRVRAGAVLMATNAYHEGFSEPFRPSYVAVHYSQFATAPLPNDLRARILAGGEGCWDTALVMSSFRVDHAGRLILGGMGDAEGLGGGLHAGWARRKLAQVYPELADVPFEHAWQGRIAMTRDHVPKVVRFGPSALSVFGYSGRGIAPGTVFGTAAAEALLEGREDALPVAPIDSYVERFTGLRSAYYEAGATLTHALKPGFLG
ncbi:MULTISPECIES: FAD-binding oxidoreductase [unclassified Salipiger]|uniref:NAD(P)/FAD-dependent oxidoreductase n=1 Tax=unclassified Salipiger TaxID=2640570 RepID=UPI0013BE880B|nr:MULTISPECIES: FAD-binding oxidoreductase [unclassified Salipiger]NDV51121.1 FAD-binding oxidoreductase [Salipiger sp. PrR003]NDW32890.1 FAD-binding oxidoreductase [Salipiger sp. PrR007]